MIIAVARTIVLYLFIIVGLRLLGKHQVSELEPAEFALALIIADVASVPMQDFGIPLLTGIVPIAVLLCLSMILSVLTMKSLKLRALLAGTPSLLIKDGKIDQKEMRRTRMTLDELLEELRLQGYTSPAGIKYAVLETNGQVSVLPYSSEIPPTAKDLHADVEDTDIPIVLINDGRLLSQNLQQLHLSEEWLHKKLKQLGVHGVKEVFFLSIDQSKQLYFIRKELK